MTECSYCGEQTSNRVACSREHWLLANEPLKKARRARDRQKQRAYRYGFASIEEMHEWIATQPVVCPICNIREATCIDHCHLTGVRRGYLCNTCNRGVGLLNDDPVALLRAVEYLTHAPVAQWN